VSAVDRVQDVYATSYRRLVDQLTGVTGDPAEAEDAVMEAFARAMNSSRSFLAADNPETWLRTVAVNVTRTRWRRSRFFRDAAAQREAVALHPLDDRAPQPGFEVVLDRARRNRRRRRTSLASGLVAVAVVGGLALALGGPGGSSTEPPRPAPTTSWDGTSEVDAGLPGDVRAVLDDDQLQLWAVAGGSTGGVAALWRGCDLEPCRFAVVTRDGDQVSGDALGASFPLLSAVPGGWLVEDATGTFRVGPSGERTQIYVTAPGNADVMAGDTAVETGAGWRLLRGDKLVGVPAPRDDPTSLLGAFLTDSGRLVVAVSHGPGQLEALASDDGGTSWAAGLTRGGDEARSAVLGGNGDHVAVVFLGDDPDGSLPVVGVQASHDAGRTWTAARGLDTEGGDRVRDLSSLAVAPDGTAYVSTGSHHVVRVDLAGDALPIQLSSSDRDVFIDGDDVCVVGERGRYDQLTCSSDGGTNWSARPLPGLG